MSPTTHLESFESSPDFTITTKMDHHTSLSKTASLPALPARSALRASRIISSYDLSARLSQPITLDTAPAPSPSTTPELSPSDPNPYSSSDDDDSADDDDLDPSTLSILARPSAEHDLDAQADGKARTSDVARVVEFMFVGKPTVVSIALTRPPSSDSAKLARQPTPTAPLYPPRRDSRPCSTAASTTQAPPPPTPTEQTPPQLPRRPNAPRLSLVPTTAAAKPSRASTSAPALPFLNTDPFSAAAASPTSAGGGSLRSPEVASPASSSFMGTVRRATLRRMPSMGRLGRRESVGEGLGMGMGGRGSVSVVSLPQVEEGGKEIVTYDEIVRGAIHGPPPLPTRPAQAHEKEVLSPRSWGGMMGLGRR